MADKNPLLDILSELSDSQLFAFSTDDKDAMIYGLNAPDFHGLALGAPSKVDLSQQEHLPLLLFTRTTGLRNWEVLHKPNTRLVAVELNTGRTEIRLALGGGRKRAPADGPRSMEGEPPVEDDAEASHTDLHQLEAREVLDLSWEPGVWAFTSIIYDWVSNTTVVELADPTEEPTPPGTVARSKAAALAETARRGIEEPDVFPAYSRRPETPTLEEVGTAVTAPETVIAGEPIPIYGAIKTALLESSLVAPPPDPIDGEEEEAPAPEEKLPTAVIKGSLILLRRDEAETFVVPVEAPLFSREPPEPEQVVDVCFALNLAEALEEPLEPGTYLVYLVAGAFVGVPAVMTVP